MNRPTPKNLDCEPPYPDHDTVLISIRFPEMTAHLSTERCPHEHPHLIAECGEFVLDSSKVSAVREAYSVRQGEI